MSALGTSVRSEFLSRSIRRKILSTRWRKPPFVAMYLFRRVLVWRELYHFASHFVNRTHNRCGQVNLRRVRTEHLVVGNRAITIDIVKLKRPAQLLIKATTACNTQCANKLFKVDGAILILVEYIENVLC